MCFLLGMFDKESFDTQIFVDKVHTDRVSEAFGATLNYVSPIFIKNIEAINMKNNEINFIAYKDVRDPLTLSFHYFVFLDGDNTKHVGIGGIVNCSYDKQELEILASSRSVFCDHEYYETDRILYMSQAPFTFPTPDKALGTFNKIIHASPPRIGMYAVLSQNNANLSVSLVTIEPSRIKADEAPFSITGFGHDLTKIDEDQWYLITHYNPIKWPSIPN